MKNMFAQPLTIHTGSEGIHAADRESQELMRSAFAGDYRVTDVEALTAFVRHALGELDEQDRFNLLRGIQMPFDARVWFMWHPAYVIAAAGVWLMQQAPERMDADMRDALARMMEAAFAHGILNHGYDVHYENMKIVAMLGAAGGKRLMEEAPEFSPAFVRAMEPWLMDPDDLAWEGNPEGDSRFSGEFRLEETTMMARQMKAAWNGKPHTVFTYGTLMRGQSAAGLMASAAWSGHASLQGYAMHDLGAFPGIVRNERETALGEIWFVDDGTLAALDRYEGEGTLYTRQLVTVHTAYGGLDAWVYVYNGDARGEILREGWSAKDEDYVWYAAYGSNLSAKRFACYLQGGRCDANGREYAGCADKTLWTDEYFDRAEGSVFFGSHSPSWGGGVAFYNPGAAGKIVTRMYRIRRSQLHDVQRQEGASDAWYGRLVCLGVEGNGEAIFTFTTGMKQERTAPAEGYVALIRSALVEEAGMEPHWVDKYISKMMPPVKRQRRRKGGAS